MDVGTACDENNRGGYDFLISQGCEGSIHFEIYYKENSNFRPITYALTIAKDRMGGPYVKEERLRQRRPGNISGRPLSLLYLVDGKGYAFERMEGDQDDDGTITGKKGVELSNIRKLGIVTLGAMKQYSRIEKFLSFLESWFYAGYGATASDCRSRSIFGLYRKQSEQCSSVYVSGKSS